MDSQGQAATLSRSSRTTQPVHCLRNGARINGYTLPTLPQEKDVFSGENSSKTIRDSTLVALDTPNSTPGRSLLAGTQLLHASPSMTFGQVPLSSNSSDLYQHTAAGNAVPLVWSNSKTAGSIPLYAPHLRAAEQTTSGDKSHSIDAISVLSIKQQARPQGDKKVSETQQLSAFVPLITMRGLTNSIKTNVSSFTPFSPTLRPVSRHPAPGTSPPSPMIGTSAETRHSTAQAATDVPTTTASRPAQELYNQALRPASGRQEVSVTGRLSDATTGALIEGLGELDKTIQKIKAATGLSLQQILRRWQPASRRRLNFWNIYQKYFQTRPDEELARLKGKPQMRSAAKPSQATIRAAYRAFKSHEPNHESILETFWQIYQIEGSNTTLNARSRDFQKFVNGLKRLAESGSAIHGFEVVFCAAGSVVQQDQSLSSTYCSPMVPNFFSNRLRLTDHEIEGHLKAHAYDHASRSTLSHTDHEAVPRTSSAVGNTPTETTLQEAAVSTKNKGQSRRLLRILKDAIVHLVEPCNLAQLRRSHFPFSALPTILAMNGWVVENWPEDVPFPCDLPKGKGVAGLRACYRGPLLKALNDAVYPVRIVKRYSEAIPPSEPVIIGVPPPPDSEHMHGRRRFLNEDQVEDRKGPARRVASPVSKQDDHSEQSRRLEHREAHADGEGRSRKRRKTDEIGASISTGRA